MQLSWGMTTTQTAFAFAPETAQTFAYSGACGWTEMDACRHPHCCDKARTPRREWCVCVEIQICPVHGTRHHGTHE